MDASSVDMTQRMYSSSKLYDEARCEQETYNIIFRQDPPEMLCGL
jgi:hypothetical protein